MQDATADALAHRLNEGDDLRDKPQRWRTRLSYPKVNVGAEPLPTITVVEKPHGTLAFDIVEAYWSPLTKGRVSSVALLSWLFRTVFVPANTDARLETPPRKMLFDVLYIGLAALGATAFVALAIFLAVVTTDRLWTLGELGGDVSHARRYWFLAAEAILTIAGSLIATQTAEAALRAWRATHREAIAPLRLIFIAIFAVLAIALLAVAALLPNDNGLSLGWSAILAAFSVTFFRLSRVLLQFLVDFLGDVLIYTTRDENSEHFAARNSVVTIVRETIRRALAETPFGRETPYDRVIIMAHSLGSTIALDAIMSLYEHREEGSILPGSWNRLRAFITFGSSIEKTRYFTEASEGERHSVSFNKWRDEVYGQIFTPDVAMLHESAGVPVVWANYWYAEDPIANPICTFRSFLQTGQSIATLEVAESEAAAAAAARADPRSGREYAALPALICQNAEGNASMFRSRQINVHGEYLHDPWFWLGTGTSDAMAVVNILDVERLPERVLLSSPSVPGPRYEIVPKYLAMRHRRYVAP
jgi:hypothetical protein